MGSREGGVLSWRRLLRGVAVVLGFGLVGMQANAAEANLTAPSLPLASVTGSSQSAETAGSITYTIRLSAPVDHDAAVDFDVTGSAEVEADYEPVTGRIIIPAGDTEAVISVGLLNDTLAEAPETFTLVLQTSEDVDVDPAAARATTVIIDDDEVGLELQAGSIEVSEDGNQTGEFAVALTQAPAVDVTVTITPEDQTEVRSDKSVATFTPSNWSEPQTITLRGVADGEADGDQQSKVALSLSAPSLKSASTLPSIDVTTVDADGGSKGANGEPQQFHSATQRFMANRLHVIAGANAGHASIRSRQTVTGNSTVQITGENGTVEGNFAVSSQGVMSALDRRKAKVEATADLPNSEELVSDWNVWTEGQFGFYQDKGGVVDTKGDFFVGYLGLDYRVGENTIAGVMGEFDWMESKEQGSINEINGNGFLVGPYVSSEIASNIFFDARAMWGLSDNDATQDVAGTVFTGDFQTERILLEAKLAGQHDIESLRITPEVAVLYTSDDQSAYTISGGGGTVLVPGQTVDLGRASAGLTFTHLGMMGEHAFEPFIGAKLNWDFENPTATADDLKAAITAGFVIRSEDMEFGARATWDGVGSDDYEALSGKLTFSHSF